MDAFAELYGLIAKEGNMERMRLKKWAMGGWRHDTHRLEFIGFVMAKDMDEAFHIARSLWSGIAYISTAKLAE